MSGWRIPGVVWSSASDVRALRQGSEECADVPVPVFMDAVADFALLDPEASAGAGHPLPASFRSRSTARFVLSPNYFATLYLFYYHLPFYLLPLFLRALRQVLSRIYFVLLVRRTSIFPYLLVQARHLSDMFPEN